MEELHQWELDIIAAIQQAQRPVLDNVFRAITMLGDELFYLLLLPLLLWSVERRLGARLAVLFLLSVFMNILLKELFQQPRPFELDPSLKIGTSDGYGLPSGHAQMAVVVWGSVAIQAHHARVRAATLALVLLIGFSRIYLGVHFPTDVLAGWSIGLLCLALFLALQPPMETWLSRLNLRALTLLVTAVPLGLFLLYPTDNTATVAGALAGVGAGLALMHRYAPFDVCGTWWQHGARLLIGTSVVFALFLGLRLLFPSEDSSGYLAFRLARYGLIGLWATLGAPWLFLRLRLAGPGIPQPAGRSTGR